MGIAEPLGCSINALQAFDHRAGIAGHQGRVLRVTFIGPAPAIIANHRECGGEGPVLARDTHLKGRHLADTPDQVRIIGSAKADVVRKECRTHDVVVAVDRIGAPEDRNPCPAPAGVDAGFIELVRQRKPGLRRGVVVAARRGIAAIQYRTQIVSGGLCGCDRRDIGLDDLTDLLLQRHAGQERRHAGFERGIRLKWRAAFGPDRRVHAGGRTRLGAQRVLVCRLCRRRERAQSQCGNERQRQDLQGRMKQGHAGCPLSASGGGIAAISRFAGP